MKESVVSEMVMSPIKVNTRKMGVKSGTSSYHKVVLEDQRRKLRKDIREITKKSSNFEATN